MTDPENAPIQERLRAAGLPPLPRMAWLAVDLDALVGNAATLRSMAGPNTELAVVVKADGYGHGIEMAALAGLAGGASALSVATLDEGLCLRGLGHDTRIFVNYPVPREALPEAAAARVEVVAGSAADVDALVTLGCGAPAVHVEVDTGMTRGGLLPPDVPGTLARFEGAGVRVEGLWSHLATPGDAAVTARQVEAFEEVVAVAQADNLLPGIVHLDATGGLIAGIAAYDLIRIGLGFYGLLPGDLAVPPAARALRPALEVLAAPVRVVEVPAGTAVGYGGTWVARRPSRIATLPIGYVDSWLRGPSSGSDVLVRGIRVPVVGRVSSDSLTIDVTDVPGRPLGPGDEVMLLGRQGSEAIPAEEVAARRGTITWEVLQALPRRLTRVYFAGDRPVAIRRADGGIATVPDLRSRLRKPEQVTGASLP